MEKVPEIDVSLVVSDAPNPPDRAARLVTPVKIPTQPWFPAETVRYVNPLARL